MKNTLLLLTTLFCVYFLYAQNTKPKKDTPLPNEDFFTKSELVIEGQPINIVATYDTKGNKNRDDIYSIFAIRVLKVYKGDPSLTGEIVYRTEKGGVLGQENWLSDSRTKKYSDGEVIIEDEIGYMIISEKDGVHYGVSHLTPQIYFLSTSDFPDILDSKYSPYKKYKHFIKYTKPGWCYPTMYVCGNAIIGLKDLFFQTREEFYTYMRKFKGFTVPEPVIPIEKPAPPKTNEFYEVAKDSIDPIIQKHYKFLMDSLEKEFRKEDTYKKKVRKKPKSSRAYNTIFHAG